MDEKTALYLQQARMKMEKELLRITEKNVDMPKTFHASIRYLLRKEKITAQAADLLRHTYSLCLLPKRKDIFNQDRIDIDWAIGFLQILIKN